jgi:hypothetical protein
VSPYYSRKGKGYCKRNKLRKGTKGLKKGAKAGEALEYPSRKLKKNSKLVLNVLN